MKVLYSVLHECFVRKMIRAVLHLKKLLFLFLFFSKYKQDKKHEIYKAVAEILGKVD